MQWISNSPEETQALGGRLRLEFPEAKVICLKGPLGSGKTHFTKGIGHSLGIPPAQIKSPTFTTLMEHHGDKILYHCDFYRWEENATPQSSVDWWNELLEQPNGVIVAEWSDRIQQHIPSERLEIEFKWVGESQRILILQSYT